MVKTQAILPNEEVQNLNVLIDTGAEACLVRQGLSPSNLMQPAQKPLTFETADGQALQGGYRCINVKLLFDCFTNELPEAEKMHFEAEFFEANIKVDAILSYPWLAEAKLGVFPHHKALVLDSVGFIFLYEVGDRHKKRSDD